MSYSLVLKKIISDSTLTYKEISEKCKITPSYISKLANGKIAPPSDEVSIKIAEACNADPNLLILEAYFEKAPEVLTNFLDNIRMQFQAVSLKTNNNVETLNKSIYKKLASEDSISKFITEFNLKDISSVNINTNGIQVKDDSMEPLIPKGSYVSITNFNDNPEYTFKYESTKVANSSEEDRKLFNQVYDDKIGFSHAQDGDILLGWDLDDKKLVIRSFQGYPNITEPPFEYCLIPMNTRYKIKFYNMFNTYYNLAKINSNKDDLEVNNNLINYINKKQICIIAGKEVNTQETNLGICILGKVNKITIKV